ncbi:MAG: hydrogenase formation protein HypD [Verrucomicrobia bacterium]|nr:hydrogenase formation protein HypD [Verrucomicrobiota bacterium]
MKFVDEYRQPGTVQRYARALARLATRPWTLMEMCGGQTHTIVKFGVDQLLPPGVTLVHGPGCPVCVTPVGLIDKAIEIAGRPGVTLCSFGDMLRVPGTRTDLLGARAAGGEVRVVYSPLDAVRLAANDPRREVVFFAVGFETTAPANALAVCLARRQQLRNFSLLVAQVRLPPVLERLLVTPGNRVQGFLAAGHVCTVMGYTEYEPIARHYGVPIVVTGFEPLDILEGVHLCVAQLEAGRATVQNQYSRSVRRHGNHAARQLVREVFETVPRRWRGLGEIPQSGLALRQSYRDFDAEHRFGLAQSAAEPHSPCISHLILQGAKKPHECPAFGKLCTPEHPLGAPMVSSEGACAAYRRYRGTTGRLAAQL